MKTPRRLALRGWTRAEMFDLLHFYEQDDQYIAQKAIVAFVSGMSGKRSQGEEK